jgi:hypothetical protein
VAQHSSTAQCKTDRWTSNRKKTAEPTLPHQSAAHITLRRADEEGRKNNHGSFAVAPLAGVLSSRLTAARRTAGTGKGASPPFLTARRSRCTHGLERVTDSLDCPQSRQRLLIQSSLAADASQLEQTCCSSPSVASSGQLGGGAQRPRRPSGPR